MGFLLLVLKELNDMALAVAKNLNAFVFKVWAASITPKLNQESYTGSDNSMSRLFTSQTKN